MNNMSKLTIGSAAGIFAVIAGGYALASLTTVPAGYVGVRVNLYADKGVDNEVVGTGRYFVGINEQLYKFPTFNQLISYEEPRGIAESTRLRAQAEADAIAIKAKALRDNPDIIQLNAIEKWDGKLPNMMTAGGTVPFVPVK